MPQGVEHNGMACMVMAGGKVRIPLMPQGVEHNGEVL
jgi:hypothetical protein